MKIDCDIAIVGAGSAGCALAGRLARETNWRVVLIEAGGRSRDPWLRIPAGYYRTAYSDRYSWRLRTLPQAHMGGRQFEWPRGKTLGGSSAINGLVYIRGQAEDYRGWRARGCVGWDWDDVLPLFRKSENHPASGAPFHGRDGELRVERQRLSWPILDAVREAAEELGVPQVDDFNGGDNFGSSYFEVNQKAGLRFNAVRAFIRPVRHRRNLTVMPHAQAERIVFDGLRASGVELRLGGKPARVHASGEVILSAGAIGTPQLLQLSGLGAGSLLQAHGIALVRDLPGVGENLQDHLQIRTAFRITGARTLNERQSTLAGKARLITPAWENQLL